MADQHTPLIRPLRSAVREIVLLDLYVILLVVGLASRLLRQLSRREPSASSSRFRLVRVDLLGDVVNALAGARLLKGKFPAAEISMLTLPQTAPLARLSPDVDEVIAVDTNEIRHARAWLRPGTYRRLLYAWRDLRGGRVDITYSLSGRTASLLSFLGGPGAIAGYVDEAYPLLLTRAIRNGRRSLRRRQPDAEFIRQLIEGDVLPARAGQGPNIVVTDPAKIRASELLSGAGIQTDERFAVFHSGSGYGDVKRWPAAYFAALARRLESDGIKTVLIGSERERALAGEIEAESPTISLAGKTNLDELTALLSLASIVISGDSGPLHLATALGAPVVGIYGPTDPAVNGPIAWRGQPVHVLRQDLACSPCYSVRVRAECPLGDPICMRLVTPEDVYDAAHRILFPEGTRSLMGGLSRQSVLDGAAADDGCQM